MKNIYIICILFVSNRIYSQTTIHGTVKNFTDSVFYINETGGFDNITRAWRDRTIAVKINKNNTFKVIIPEESIGAWCIRTEKGNQIFHLIKGQVLNLTVDFSKKIPATAFGKYKDDFNYLISEQNISNSYIEKNNFFERIQDNTIENILKERKSLVDHKKKHLDKFRTTHKLSNTYYKWLISHYRYEPYERTLVENVKKRDSIGELTAIKLIENGMNDDYAALNTPEYNDLVDFYVTYLMKKDNIDITPTSKFHFIITSKLIINGTRDVYLSRLLSGLAQAPDSIYNPLFKKYDNIVTNRKIKQLIVTKRTDYAPSIHSNASNTNTVSSLTELFKKYNGKVVYIDFWASWCIPCRAEMPISAALYEKLKGEKIIFLYLGYNDREAAWLKARKQLNINGEHYLLNSQMIKEADDVFGIDGIPHYAIIDKNGDVIIKKADKPSEVYRQLVLLLEK